MDKKKQPEWTMSNRDCRNGLTRRSLILGAMAGVGATRASAQEPWWQNLQGFGTPAGVTVPSERPKRVAAPLEDLRPGRVPWRSDEMLRYMEHAIAHHEKIVAKGGWPGISKGRSLRLGDDDERVEQVRRRLLISGELDRRSQAYVSSYSFDETLEAAVKKFQVRHGVRNSGRLDIPTRAHLNISAEQRLAQLKLNYQRIQRLLQSRIEDRYVFVNAPGFQLEAVEGFEVQERHRVIVGKPNRQTPELRATILNLNFFPYWRVPLSVAKLDLIPRLQNEPEYLEKEKIMVRQGSHDGPIIDPTSIDWTQADPSRIMFRQEPGPQNALGLVRIDMPNSETVYMHDTPMKPLFKSRDRAFSAGCVRVEDVFDLVAWIAKYEPGFSGGIDQVQSVIDAGQPLDVKLTRPVPVYFAYLTAWAEDDGGAVFRADIYNRDGVQELAGESDPESPPPAEGLAP